MVSGTLLFWENRGLGRLQPRNFSTGKAFKAVGDEVKKGGVVHGVFLVLISVAQESTEFVIP